MASRSLRPLTLDRAVPRRTGRWAGRARALRRRVTHINNLSHGAAASASLSHGRVPGPGGTASYGGRPGPACQPRSEDAGRLSPASRATVAVLGRPSRDK